MHKTQMYENLMDMLEREVKEISNKSQLDAQTLDNLYKIMMSIKAADKHMETLEGGMSQDRGMSYGDRSYGMRDGRYSRDNFRDSSYRGQSYENSYGYSRDNARQKLIGKLSTILDDTMSETERQTITDCIERLR